MTSVAKAGTPTPYHDAVNGPPNVLFRNDGRGGFVDVTRETGLDVANDRFSFSAAWGDYDGDRWPDLVVTNDFGRKNLYRNLGLRDGKVTFEDVAAKAGVEDHAAGMSVFWFDYDGDGRLDIHGGQMWSDSGLRVTACPDFMPDAPPDVRALYRRHARGNSLFRNRGDGTFEDVTLAAGVNMGRWSCSRFEAVYFERRVLLHRLVIAECVENKGRFLDDIANALWVRGIQLVRPRTRRGPEGGSRTARLERAYRRPVRGADSVDNLS